MVEIKNADYQTLARAVTLWTGYDAGSCPTRDDESLRSVFPVDEAVRLVTVIKGLEEDFYKSQAHVAAKNLSEMKVMALSDFKRLHPELPEDIANALTVTTTTS